VPEAARVRWFEQGVRAYQSGAFFEAHEHWEELWRDEKQEDERQFLQGLIQVAAAMHKIVEQGKPAPAARLLERALIRLRRYPSVYRRVHLAKLVTTAELARQTLASMPKGEPYDFPDALVAVLEVDGMTEPS
jgi:predicted metal-dependent hydrolase